MCSLQPTDVHLRPWSDGDFPLLARLLGDPAMTVYIGGPETAEELHRRHARYCRLPSTGLDQVAAGSVGYWEIEWDGQPAWEASWSVLPEFQGQGIATLGMATAVEHARAEHKHRFLHAFPAIANAASNGVCRKVGFTLQGEVELEDRRSPGHFLRFHDWRLDLLAPPPKAA